MTKDKTVGVPTGYRAKLNVKERLGLSTLFPQKGNMIALQLMEDITEKTKFTQKEIDTLGLKLIPGPKNTTRWAWDSKKEKEKQVEFTKTEMHFLKKRIELLDKAEDISPDTWPLIKKLDAFKVEK